MTELTSVLSRARRKVDFSLCVDFRRTHTTIMDVKISPKKEVYVVWGLCVCCACCCAWWFVVVRGGCVLLCKGVVQGCCAWVLCVSVVHGCCAWLLGVVMCCYV